MNKRKFQNALRDLAVQSIPVTLDLRPAILARAARLSQPRSRPHFGPANRFGLAGPVLAALALAATAYAASPVIGRLLQMDDPLRNVDPATLGQTLDLSQSLGPVTVTLQWAYASADRVMIGYSIRSADGRRFDPYGELTDPTGQVFGSQGGYGVTGHSDVLNLDLPPGEGTYVEAFPQCQASPADAKSPFHCYPIQWEAATSSNGTRSLTLHFAVNASELIIPATVEVPTLSAWAAEAQTAVRGELIGPFTFEFTIPIAPASQ